MADETKLQDFLFANAMKGDWKKVVDTYHNNPSAHELVITKSRDTALHLAVFDNQEEIVAELVHILCLANHKKTLEKQNDRKNTPLHIAASLGSVRMCRAIASVDNLLLELTNEDGETPLFLAALNGHKDAFLCLYFFCSSGRLLMANRRENGDSVLHCALRNEHFDLAFQILNLNKDIANSVNRQGQTALHILATKPTAFRSGDHIGGWRKIVYYCKCVDPLKPASAPPTSNLELASRRTMSKPKRAYFPDNYDTCIAFFRKLRDGFLIASTLKRNFINKNCQNDEAKNDADLEKDVAKESANNVDEAHESTDTQLLEADEFDQDEPKIRIFPENYSTCINFLEIIFSAIMIFLGFGSIEIRKIREKKEKHTWSVQVMDKLLELASTYKYVDDGNTPMGSRFPNNDETETSPYFLHGEAVAFNARALEQGLKGLEELKNVQATENEVSKKKETPLLIAAKNGVVEMVRGIFERFPVAIHDVNMDKKNIVHLAVENRQPDVYMFLLEKKYLESVFRAVDNKGNSALHLAANIGDHKPWRITGAALQMQWEVKWYQFVKESAPLHFFALYNDDGKIAKNIFQESHQSLAKSGGEWLTSTSESCSVVAALIATVAFASAATIPGGNHGEEGTPLLQDELGFFIFATSSLIALCLSVTSVIMFLAILTSRFDEKDFRSSLPRKLLVGLSSLFFSIVAMFVSFCAGHYFLLASHVQNIAAVLYTVTFLPVTLIFAIGQLPLYFDLLQAILKKVPTRRSDVILSD